jgi:enediyne biosynthesis protein E4
MKKDLRNSPLLLTAALTLLASPASAETGADMGHNHGADTPAAAPAPGRPANEIRVPPTDVNLETLDLRIYGQVQSAWKFKVPFDFRFRDELARSGITFENFAVDDALIDYKAVHYDHGNGLAAADVDGDGRTDLYFVSQLGGNELWRNLGAGKFENITAKAGVGLKERVSISAAFADIDNDGDQDLFVTTVKFGNALFENDGKGSFKDISQAAGVDYKGHSSGATFFDYDRDGKLDLFVANIGIYTSDEKGRGGFYLGLKDAFSGHNFPERSELSRLYRNLGNNKFQDVTQATGLRDGGWNGDASFNDMNGDGFPDLYVLNMQGDNRVWINQGGKTFADQTEKYFPATPWGAMGIKFFDPDRDGDADIYITDMHSDMAREVPPAYEKIKGRLPDHWNGQNNIAGNAFFMNFGKGQYEDLSQPMNLENFWPWGFSAADLNADGWEDVFVTASMSYPFRYQVNSLLLNNAGEGFLDAEFLTGVEPRNGLPYKEFFKLDCSGKDAAHRLCQNRKGQFTVMGSRGSRTSVAFDMDADGDLDIVTGELQDVPMVLVSDLASRTQLRWLTVKLQGKKSNRDGLGAKVTVKAGGKTSTQWHDGKSGYLSFSALPLYFGLGSADKVDSVEVSWPSGATQKIDQNIAINKLLEIQEP